MCAYVYVFVVLLLFICFSINEIYNEHSSMPEDFRASHSFEINLSDFILNSQTMFYIIALSQNICSLRVFETFTSDYTHKYNTVFIEHTRCLCRCSMKIFFSFSNDQLIYFHHFISVDFQTFQLFPMWSCYILLQ